MTKYYRRAGTVAYRYIIQAEIEKIELKVPTTGQYPQRFSVIFKRGDVRKETKNASLVEGGVAYFNEKLSLPATIYYDTRKKSYLQKEATLAVNVYSKRAAKLMGVTKFDLAPFINQNIQEQNIVLKMDKCPDKNAKFFLKISMNQIMELGASKRSSRHSFKDIVKHSSFRGSMKENQLPNIHEIMEDNEKRTKEESKISLEEDQMDDLYSYYTGSNSPTSLDRLKEIEETTSMIVKSPAKTTKKDESELETSNFNLTSPPKFHVFDQLETESPQKIETSVLNESEDEINVGEEFSKEPKELEKSIQNFQVQNDYEKLRKSYAALEQKYEEAIKSQEPQVQNSNEDSFQSSLKVVELEKRYKEMENKNDLLTRRIEELDQLNLEYSTQIKGYIAKENQFVSSHEENEKIAPQSDKNIDDFMLRLKQQPNYDTESVQIYETTIRDILQKLVETNNTMMKKDEIYALEKEDNQKRIQALELNIQQLTRENEQYNQKQRPKNLGASFDNTGLFASFKTIEESSIEDNEDVSDRHHEASHILDRSAIENTKLAEISALKQEITQLNSKLSATTNIQKKYEEEVQKKSSVEQELKSLKKELDKANKGWSYAEEERYELASKLKEYEDGSKMDKRVDNLETDLFKLKVKLCEVMNVAMEFGRADMLDRIETIMNTNELSDLRSSLKQSFWD